MALLSNKLAIKMPRIIAKRALLKSFTQKDLSATLPASYDVHELRVFHSGLC